MDIDAKLTDNLLVFRMTTQGYAGSQMTRRGECER